MRMRDAVEEVVNGVPLDSGWHLAGVDAVHTELIECVSTS